MVFLFVFFFLCCFLIFTRHLINLHYFVGLDVGCSNDSNVHFVKFDDSCKYYFWYNLGYRGCAFFTTVEEVENYDIGTLDMVNEIYQLTELTKQYTYECDNSSDVITKDIGYSLDAGSDVTNDAELGLICCRGFQSCAYTGLISANQGNILCSSYESCIDVDLIWTGEATVTADTNTSVITKSQASIFWAARSACAGSTIESAFYILCSAFYSCLDTLTLSGHTL